METETPPVTTQTSVQVKEKAGNQKKRKGKKNFSEKRKHTNHLGMSFAFCLGCLFGIYVGMVRRIPFIQNVAAYSIGIYTGETPLDIVPDLNSPNPVLTAKDVTDVPASFVADPFMIQHKNKWYMYFEVLNTATNQGDIGLASSTDGVDWEYEKIVLDESYHLSYPLVFEWEEYIYMIPESNAAYGIFLYRAQEFPYTWEKVLRLVKGNYSDPTVFFYNGFWYMFASDRNDILNLFYAENLEGPWKEHPMNPLITGDANIARPAGRVIKYDDTIIRLAQDCEPVYGQSVHAFEVTELTPETYRDVPVSNEAIIEGTGKGWNAERMHHIDAHRIGPKKWIACVDGVGRKWKFNFKY